MLRDGGTRTGHPVPAGVAALDEAMGDLLGCSLIGLDAAGTRATLVALADAEARLDALRLRVAAHADEVAVGADSGATSTGVWWACATRQTRPQAAGQVRLAQSLQGTWRRVGAGLASGGVHLDQAHVIVSALEALPADLDPGVLANAEQHLVDLAALHDPVELRRLGRAVLEAVAPQVAEEDEGRRLAAELARAREKTRLTMSPDAHGAVHGRFTVPELHAAILRKSLWALASPAHRAAVCDWPPAMFQLHHDQPWAEGGVTDVEHARLLCPHHHRRIHDPTDEHQVLADHQVRFHRRI